MPRTVRKNLMVDPVPLATLARQRGTSESEAARAAVDLLLNLNTMADSLGELQRLGAFSDTEEVQVMYGPLPADRDTLVGDHGRTPSG